MFQIATRVYFFKNDLMTQMLAIDIDISSDPVPGGRDEDD